TESRGGYGDATWLACAAARRVSPAGGARGAGGTAGARRHRERAGERWDAAPLRGRRAGGGDRSLEEGGAARRGTAGPTTGLADRAGGAAGGAAAGRGLGGGARQLADGAGGAASAGEHATAHAGAAAGGLG